MGKNAKVGCGCGSTTHYNPEHRSPADRPPGDVLAAAAGAVGDMPGESGGADNRPATLGNVRIALPDGDTLRSI